MRAGKEYEELNMFEPRGDSDARVQGLSDHRAKPQVEQQTEHHEGLINQVIDFGTRVKNNVSEFVKEHPVESTAGALATGALLLAATKGRSALVEAGLAGSAARTVVRDSGEEALANSVAQMGKRQVEADLAEVAARNSAAGATPHLLAHEGGALLGGTARRAGQDLSGQALSHLEKPITGSTLSRSARVGALPLGALLLAGCEPEHTEKVAVYKDPAECKTAGVFSENYCDSKFAEAKQVHEQTAPTFDDKKKCEDTTNVQCQADTTQTTTHTGSTFIYRPYMSGYVLGQPSNDEHNRLTGRSIPAYSPVGGSGYITSHGEDISTKTGEAEVSSRSLSSASRSTGTAEGESAKAGGQTESFEHTTTSTSRGTTGETAGEAGHGSAFEATGHGSIGGARGVFGGEGGAHVGGGGFHGAVGE